MSTLRHRFRVVIDGTKYEIVTSARDLAAAEIGPNANTNDPGAMATTTFRLLHAACVRLNLPNIPSDWESFTDLVDEVDDLEADTGDDINPTRAADSDTPQSL